MKKILVVDDDLVVLATLSMGLKQAGYQVFQVSNGASAIQVEQFENPDLAILDMRMPGLSGLDVAKILHARGRTPFIFLSAFNDDEAVKAAADAGALGYLVKPIEISRIVPAIEVAMVRHDELSKAVNNSINLIDSLNKNREIDIAIGLVMERYNIDRASAFDALRDYARSNRCKAAIVAQRLIDGERLELNLA
jgi:response regulator NasT